VPPPQAQYDLDDVDEEDEIQDRPLNEFNEDEPGEVLGHQRVETPEPDIEGNAPVLNPSRIEHLHFAQEFINEVSRATLDNGGLDDLTIDN